eukprot:scaffold74684_cov55-Phaeocystis_antarctica.AAC.2
MPRLHPSPSTRALPQARARARSRARVILGQLHRYRRACCCPVLTFNTSILGRGEAMKVESRCTICALWSARCLPL